MIKISQEGLRRLGNLVPVGQHSLVLRNETPTAGGKGLQSFGHCPSLATFQPEKALLPRHVSYDPADAIQPPNAYLGLRGP